MAASFRTRPWLVASAARPSFSPSFLAARGLAANLEQTRQYAATRRRIDPRLRNAMQHSHKTQGSQKSTGTMMKEMLEEKKVLGASDMAVIAPATVVPLPFSKAPTDFRRFFRYYWLVTKCKFRDRAQIVMQTFQLKDRWYKRATFKADRKGVVQVALNLHAAMSHSLAGGGSVAKRQLLRICVPKLYRSLVAAIESRPEGKSYRWERLEVIGRPRLVDHKWSEIDTGNPVSFIQAVVRIRSKQRLTEVDAKGNHIGSKEMELVEHMVLWHEVDKVYRRHGDWLLLGTLKETTLEELEQGLNLAQTAAKLHAEDKLRSREKQLAREQQLEAE